MKEKTKEIKTFDGKLFITERKALHSKKNELLPYLSFSDGQNAMGVFLDEKTKENIVKFLAPPKRAKKNDDDNQTENNQTDNNQADNGNGGNDGK